MTHKIDQVRSWIIGLLLLVPIFGASQDSLEGIHTISEYKNDSIRLRWIPANYDIWRQGIERGYNIFRVKLSENGDTLTRQQIEDSKISIVSNLLPLSTDEWQNKFDANNNLARLADTLLRASEYNGAQSLFDAASLQQSKEDAYNFSMLASTFDFDIACGMALGWQDVSIQSNAEYAYYITIGSDQPYTFAGVIVVPTHDETVYPPISDLAITQDGNRVDVAWNVNHLDRYYMAYHIERSTDGGGSYQRINEEPYINFEVDDTDKETSTGIALFQDTSVIEHRSYVYRIAGITPFGRIGTYSVLDTILIRPLPLGLGISLKDSSIADEVILTWDLLINDESFDLNQLSEYQLFRSESEDTSSEPIASLPINERSYTDRPPYTTTFYKIEALDTNGYRYSSFPVRVVKGDKIPPSVPVGLLIRKAGKSSFEISWTANQESDIEGYNLYSTTPDNDHYFTINNRIVHDSSFIYNIKSDIIHDQLCVKITAIDQSGNESDMSDCIMIDIPDLVPPSRPIITKIEALEYGIALGWELSSSDDILEHIIERKPSIGVDWTKILSISKDDEGYYSRNLTLDAFIPTSYIDSSELPREQFDYRVVAIDSSGNYSSSTISTVLPKSEGEVGVVDSFSLSPDSIELNSIYQQESFDIITYVINKLYKESIFDVDTLQRLVSFSIIAQSEIDSISALPTIDILSFLEQRKKDYWSDTTVPVIILRWKYNMNESVAYYEVHRSANGSYFTLHQSVLAEEAADQSIGGFLMYTDEYIVRDIEYLYKIRAYHSTGIYSDMSDTLYIKSN